MLLKIISAKLSERYIQTQHDMHAFCYVPFLFFEYVLFVNKGQDLHLKGCISVKI